MSSKKYMSGSPPSTTGSRGASGPPSLYPEGMYGIFAELKVYLVEESDTKEPPATFVGRIERHIEREVESLTTKDFLMKIQGALKQARMNRVITMNKNDVNSYIADLDEQGYWDEPFEAALKEGNSSKGVDEWWILVSGWNEEFKFRQDVTFKEKHSLAAPSMTLVIRALPAEWAIKSGEDFGSWKQRLRLTLQDKKGVKAEENLMLPKIEKYLQDYQKLLKEVFAVRDFSQSLRINLSGTDLESVGLNHSPEQPRNP